MANLRKQADMPKRTCTIPGCDRAHLALGYCQNHYAKHRKLGHPLAGRTYSKSWGTICTVPECSKGANAEQGYCVTHYRRFLAHGTPYRRTPAERFHNFLAPGAAPDQPFRPVPGECIVFTGSIHATLGYGRFWDGITQSYAHRFAYELHNGPIPEGLYIDHVCRVRACVNPDHLEAVTPLENVVRSMPFRKAG